MKVQLPFFSLLLSLLLISGCSTSPKALRGEIAGAPGVAAVQSSPERYQGVEVRWGGVIIGVENQRDASLVEVLSLPLLRNGRPDEDGPSSGRFIARIPSFLDPMVYTAGQAFTVRGKVTTPIEKQIGDFNYRYPVIQAALFHLWPPLPEPIPYDPYWYDPWYPYYWPSHPWYRRPW